MVSPNKLYNENTLCPISLVHFYIAVSRWTRLPGLTVRVQGHGPNQGVPAYLGCVGAAGVHLPAAGSDPAGGGSDPASVAAPAAAPCRSAAAPDIVYINHFVRLSVDRDIDREVEKERKRERERRKEVP